MTNQFHGGCLRKGRYRTEAAAIRVARRVYKERNVILYVYYCSYCLGFHLTRSKYHNDKPNTRAIYTKG